MFLRAALFLGVLCAIPYWYMLLLTAHTRPRRLLAGLGLLCTTIATVSALVLAFVPVHGQRVMWLHHDQCQSYQWLDEDWKCVPWEEAG